MSELKPCPFCGGELQYLCTEGGLKRYCHENDKKKNPNGCPLHDYHCCQYDLDIWNTRAQQQPSDTQMLDYLIRKVDWVALIKAGILYPEDTVRSRPTDECIVRKRIATAMENPVEK